MSVHVNAKSAWRWYTALDFLGCIRLIFFGLYFLLRLLMRGIDSAFFITARSSELT